jgi:hypothetical protein
LTDLTVNLWTEEATNQEAIRRHFVKYYRDLPDQFVIDCFNWEAGEGPTDYQLDSLRKLVAKRRLSIRGPHGLGKTSFAAWVILWFALTRDEVDDWKVPTTASAWRQLTKFLWPEVHKWARKLKWEKIGRDPFNENTELISLSLKLETGESFALASNDSTLIEGAHASQLLYVFDEAKTIPEETWDSAEGAFSVGQCYWLAISTPGAPEGRFYDIQRHAPGYEDWEVRHVTLTEAVRAKRISWEWAEARKRQWGEHSARYKNRVLGEFAASETDAIIPLEWIELANQTWLAWSDAGGSDYIDVVSADIARSGSDKTVLALRHASIIKELRKTEKQSTMQTAGVITAILRGHEEANAIIDILGVGAGTYDKCIEDFPNRIFAFNASRSTDTLDRSGQFGFVNVRSAAWWQLRELLDPANNMNIGLPDDDELTGDLTTPKWTEVSGGKIRVESKDTIRKTIGRSTDCGDSVVQAFWDLEQESGMDFA